MVKPLETSEKGSWRPIFACLCLIIFTTQCVPTPSKAEHLQVFTASSMQEVMRDAKNIFEAQHPRTHIHLNFAGSQVLRLQIEQGAPADLFVSANQEHTQALKKAGHLHKEQPLAYSDLVIATPKSNPSNIRELKDLRTATRIVIGTAQSPIGIYTRQMLQKTSQEWQTDFEKEVMTHVVSQENNVRLIRAKVALGEADAALVYRTDTMHTSKVRAISIPPHLNIKAAYVMAITQKASQSAVAQAFFDFFTTPKGLALLARHGFVVN